MIPSSSWLVDSKLPCNSLLFSSPPTNYVISLKILTHMYGIQSRFCWFCSEVKMSTATEVYTMFEIFRLIIRTNFEHQEVKQQLFNRPQKFKTYNFYMKSINLKWKRSVFGHSIPRLVFLSLSYLKLGYRKSSINWMNSNFAFTTLNFR